jgi:hypothetical protein
LQYTWCGCATLMQLQWWFAVKQAVFAQGVLLVQPGQGQPRVTRCMQGRHWTPGTNETLTGISKCTIHDPQCCVVVCAARNAVLSTISAHPSSAGFPFGSVVEFAVDDAGHPLLSTSTLSPHTADLQADGRCSLTVTAPGFTVSCRQQQPASWCCPVLVCVTDRGSSAAAAAAAAACAHVPHVHIRCSSQRA